jgi:hypothetical protein
MGVGTSVLLIAFIDEWVLELRRRRHPDAGSTRHE